jgi:hypothetical protein
MSKDPKALPETNEDPGLHGNKTGTLGHYSGEEYDSYPKEQLRYVEVGVSRGNRKADTSEAHQGVGRGVPNEGVPQSAPSDAGHRAYIDEETGEVHGSGAGAGGGNPGENYDTGPSGNG